MDDETELLTDEEPEETEKPAEPLEPPLFSVDTAINSAIQLEASTALSGRFSKIVAYACFAIVAAAGGLLVWQYIATGSKLNLVMLGLVALALVYLAYSYISMPKRALRRWEDSIQRSYGSKELHLCTEFYQYSLAQTMKEDQNVIVQGYSELTAMRESEHLFLLRRSKQNWFFVSKEGFTKGTAEDFRAFISERIGGK